MFNTKALDYDGRGGHVGSLRAHRCGRGARAGVVSALWRASEGPAVLGFCKRSKVGSQADRRPGQWRFQSGGRRDGSVPRGVGARGGGGKRDGGSWARRTACAHVCWNVVCLGFGSCATVGGRSVPRGSVPRGSAPGAVAVSSGGRRDDWDVSSGGGGAPLRVGL